MKKAKAKKYTQKEFSKLLKTRKGPYSYLHPAISPSGQSFDEVDDDLGIVANAKQRYITQGWMKRHRASERAEMASNLHSLMSLEGTLTTGILNAIYGYNMFNDHEGVIRKMRQEDKIVQTEAAEAEEDLKEEVASPPAAPQLSPQQSPTTDIPSISTETAETTESAETPKQSPTTVVAQLPQDVQDKVTAMTLDERNIGPEHATHRSKEVRDAHDVIAEESALLPATTANLLAPDEREGLKSSRVREEHEELEQNIVRENIEEKAAEPDAPTERAQVAPVRRVKPKEKPPAKVGGVVRRNGKKKLFIEANPNIPKKYHRKTLKWLKNYVEKQK
jgi:hypothetical protein